MKNFIAIAIIAVLLYLAYIYGGGVNTNLHTARKPIESNNEQMSLQENCDAMVGKEYMITIAEGSGINEELFEKMGALRNKCINGKVDQKLQDEMVAAIRGGDFARVREIVRKGVKVNTSHGADSQTLLQIAIINRQLEIAELLLDNGAEINAGDFNGWTALHHAARNNDREAVQFLLDNSASHSIRTRHGQLPHDLARIGENDELMEILVIPAAGDSK